MSGAVMDWQIQERAPQSVRLRARVPAGLAQLDGHFPQLPIVPGVVQLDWAVSEARRVFALPARLEQVEVLKFQAVMAPDAEVELSLSWQADKQKIEFVFSSAAHRYSSGRLVFSDPDR